MVESNNDPVYIIIKSYSYSYLDIQILSQDIQVF